MSWEPLEIVENAPERIAEFHQDHPNDPRRRRKSHYGSGGIEGMEIWRFRSIGHFHLSISLVGTQSSTNGVGTGFHHLRKSSQLEVEFPCAPTGHPGCTAQLREIGARTSVNAVCFLCSTSTQQPGSSALNQSDDVLPLSEMRGKVCQAVTCGVERRVGVNLIWTSRRRLSPVRNIFTITPTLDLTHARVQPYPLLHPYFADRQHSHLYISRLVWAAPSTISQKYFHPGGKAPSEWTRSVRDVRDSPVADYSAPGLNTTRRVAYRPPIDISPVFLALSVSYFKQTLWRWGQLWPYVGMGSLGTRMHLECDGWRCKNLSSRSFYLCAKCNFLFTNYTHHSKSPDLWGYWQSIARSVHLLSYY